MKTRHLVLVMILVLFTSSLPAFAKRGINPTKDWTYLVYLAADNNLDSAGSFSLDLMREGMTSDNNVNLIVLLDHYGANADLLRVTPTGVTQLSEYDEPDMANPETLQNFLSWGVDTYPAEHYVVVIWDHGGGWKYIIRDDTSGTRMSIEGLADAMNSVAVHLKRKFDIVIFDACLMALIEVADQLTLSTDFVVASVHSVPLEGFPYNLMFQRLINNPSVRSSDYARGIADDYHTYYEVSSAKSHLSVSAIDESKLKTLITAVDDFSIRLIDIMSQHHDDVNSARSNAQHQSGGGTNGVFWYVDLHVFCEEIAKRIIDATLNAQANDVIIAQLSAVYERHSHNVDGASYGLAINFPPNLSRYMDKSYLAQNYQDMNLIFTNETHWDEMLLEFYKY